MSSPLPQQSCNCPRAESQLILAPVCHFLVFPPPVLGSARDKAACPQCSHLFNVEVGAGTCFIEVHAILLSQLQEKDISERESVREGRCHATWHIQPHCTHRPCCVETVISADHFSEETGSSFQNVDWQKKREEAPQIHPIPPSPLCSPTYTYYTSRHKITKMSCNVAYQ